MSDLRRGSNCPPDGEKRLMYLPPRRPGTQLKRPYLIVGAIIGLFLVLAFSAGSVLINKFSTDDETGSINGQRLRPAR